MIDRSTTIRGRIEGAEDLVVRGRIEGTIELDGALLVEEGAEVLADAGVLRAEIAGLVVGSVHAREAIHVAATGRVKGDLVAPRISIARGARVAGLVETTGVSFDADPVARAEALAARRPVKRTPDRAERPERVPVVFATAASGSGPVLREDVELEQAAAPPPWPAGSPVAKPAANAAAKPVANAAVNPVVSPPSAPTEIAAEDDEAILLDSSDAEPAVSGRRRLAVTVRRAARREET